MKRGRLAMMSAAMLLMAGTGLAPSVPALAGPEPTAATTDTVDCRQPTAPTNLHVTEVSGLSVSLAWNPSTSASGDVDYWVMQDSWTAYWPINWNISSTVLQPFDGSPGEHTFTILAHDAAEPYAYQCWAFSNPITVTTS